jgi:hypothetical protein
MKIELTIKTTYLPNWGAWEGIRELVQNGRDAEVEFNAPLSVSHLNGTLRIENEGSKLDREALLLGHTSKSDRADLIGKFGEGLKLGILALVRAGRAVKIRSGAEVWIPTIARSERFDADVLVFDIQGGREDKNRVRIEIGGVTESEWSELKGRFLFLNRKRKATVVNTYAGDLLLDEADRGKIFVKGIFVQNYPKLEYGYNFANVDVDRDRKMVHGYDIEYAAKSIWREAVNSRPDLFDSFYEMVQNGAEDVRGVDSYSVSSINADVAERAYERFVKAFGEDAVPVANLAESADIEHLGKRGVIVKPQLAALLQKTVGSIETVKAQLANEAVKTYGWTDLNETEQKNLAQAWELLSAAGVEHHPSAVEVVDFRSPSLHGQHVPNENAPATILVARKAVGDADLLLEVLVHEVSHDHGADGDKGHVAAIERNWSKIVSFLRKQALAK